MTKIKQVSCSPGDEQYEIRQELKQLKILYIKQVLNLARNLFDLPVILFFFDDFKGITAG